MFSYQLTRIQISFNKIPNCSIRTKRAPTLVIDSIQTSPSYKPAVVPQIIYKRMELSNFGTGQTVIESYRIGALLGKGGFGVCHRGIQQRNSRQVAVKIISKSSQSMRKPGSIIRLRNEIAIMKELNSPMIVKLFDSFEDDDNYYLILEICEKISLTKMIKERNSLTEPEVRYFMRQLVEALIYIKSKRVIHRDVKGCNILLDKSLAIRLADFGLATYQHVEGNNRNNTCGTPNYMAPEIIKKIKYSYEIDMWAAGIVTFVALFNKCPFADPNPKQTYRKIQGLEYSFPLEKKISKAAEDFIRRILILDPHARMSAEEAVNHPFLTEQVPVSLPEMCYKRAPKVLEKINYPPTIWKMQQLKQAQQTEQQKIFKGQTVPLQSPLQQTAKKVAGTKMKRKENAVRKTIEVTATNNNKKIFNYFSPIPARDICLVEEKMVNEQKQVIPQAIKDEASENKQEEKLQPMIDEAQQIKEQGRAATEEQPLCQWLRDHLEGHPFVIDFSDQGKKFGLCYMLSSKVRGIRFNDQSTMTLDETKAQIMYIQKNLNYDHILQELSIELPISTQMKPVFKNQLYSQFVLHSTEITGLHKEAVRKYQILEGYSMSYPFRMPGKHGIIIRVEPCEEMEIQEKNLNNCLDRNRNNAKMAENSEANSKNFEKIRYECLKHWAVVRKAGKLAYLTVLNDLIQIFFEDGARFYIMKRPLKILYVMGLERKIFSEALSLKHEAEPMKTRFEFLQYFLSYLLQKQRETRYL